MHQCRLKFVCWLVLPLLKIEMSAEVCVKSVTNVSFETLNRNGGERQDKET